MENKEHSISSKPKYTGKDLALIIPTKDRPEKISNLLNSLCRQSVKVRRIIIVDGGESIESVVRSFSDRLLIDYFTCHPPGQLRQRNLAISKLNDETSLVGFLDDDLVLDPQAIENIIHFWNTLESDTAGIAFNITNTSPFKHSLIRALMGMSSKKMGKILISGYNVPLSPATANMQVEWLCGGATVWRQDIIKSHPCTEIKSRWAICEDIIFSYPLSKKYKMYVCADAKVLHEHVYDHTKTIDHRFYGRTATLWRLHFVNSNSDLSKFLCGYMLMTQIAARFVKGLIHPNERKEWDYALGQVEGLRIGLGKILAGEDLSPILNEIT